MLNFGGSSVSPLQTKKNKLLCAIWFLPKGSATKGRKRFLKNGFWFSRFFFLVNRFFFWYILQGACLFILNVLVIYLFIIYIIQIDSDRSLSFLSTQKNIHQLMINWWFGSRWFGFENWHVPWTSMVGRCISYGNSAFLGDMLFFRGVITSWIKPLPLQKSDLPHLPVSAPHLPQNIDAKWRARRGRCG